MEFLKKYWYFILVLTITVGLGVMTFLTSQKISTTLPIAPTVPQATPTAAEPACIVQFTLATCGSTCGSDAECPNDHACNGNKCVLRACLDTGVNCDSNKCNRVDNTPTPTATPTATPTQTPTPTVTLASCNNSCVVNTDCAGGLSCIEGACRNPSCTEKTNCTCNVVVRASCNNTCEINTDCSGGLVCLDGMCRNANCSEKTNCSCDVAVETSTPQIPVAGTGPSVLGATVIGGGILLLLLGLAL